MIIAYSKIRLSQMVKACYAKRLHYKCFDSTLTELRQAIKNAQRVIRDAKSIARVKRAELRLARAIIQVFNQMQGAF